MTDRVNALIVTLSHDIRVDDVRPLVNAIALLRGVLCVSVNVASIADHVAETRARMDLREKILATISDR